MEKDFLIENGVLKIYTGKKRDVIIPDGVVQIDKHAFDGHRYGRTNVNKMKTIRIPDTVKSIGEFAFRGCSALQNVIIPDQVTVIRQKTFYGCSSLESVHLPSSLRKIHYEAFTECEKLKEIHIPEGVTELPGGLFSNCKKLEHVELPDNLCELSSRLFYHCSSLREITLPDNLRIIKDHAFDYCDNLKKIELPPHLKEIGWGAFSNCEKLERIDIPSEVEIISPYTFSYCEMLFHIGLHSGLLQIRNNAFEYCVGLKSIHIPDTCCMIGESAFEGCCLLEEVEGLENVKTIGQGAFSDTEYQKHLSGFHIEDGCLVECYTEETEIRIPEECTSIGGHAFEKCRKIMECIVIPDTVDTLEEFAFFDCKKLKKIRLPGTLKEIPDGCFGYCKALNTIDIPDSVTGIGNDAFAGCSGLKEIRIPGHVKKIESGAFKDCNNLTQIHIPDSVTEIGFEAFMNCSRLKEVRLSAGLKRIPSEIFSGCKGLKQIELPEGIEEIGHGAFVGCEKLTLFLPKSIKKRERTAWGSGLYGMEVKKVFYFGRLSSINVEIKDRVILAGNYMKLVQDGRELDDDVKRVNRDWIVRNRKKFYNELLNDPQIAEYLMGEKIITLSDIDEIVKADILPETKAAIIEYKEKCFSQKAIDRYDEKKFDLDVDIKPPSVEELRKLFQFKKTENGTYTISKYIGAEKNVTVPAMIGKIKVSAIGERAFSSADHIEQVQISFGVKIIGSKAFSQCRNLKKVDFPETVIMVGKEAFEDCSSLESIIMPPKLGNVPAGLFRGCCRLKEVVYEGDLLYVDYSGFQNCGQLETLKDKEGIENISRVFGKVYKNDPFYITPVYQRLCEIQKALAKTASCNKGEYRGIILKKDDSYEGEYYHNIRVSAYYETSNHVGNFHISKNIPKMEEQFDDGKCRYSVHPDGTTTLTECYKKNILKYEVKPGTVVIEKGAFDGCEHLRDVRLNEELQIIKSGAFNNTSIRSMIIPESIQDMTNLPMILCERKYGFSRDIKVDITLKNNKYYFYEEGILYQILDGGYRLVSCRSDEKEICIKQGTREIADDAFRFCRKLRTVVVPASVEKVCACAFADCIMLEKIKFEEGLREISGDAFDGCRHLKEISFPASVKLLPVFFRHIMVERRRLYASYSNLVIRFEHGHPDYVLQDGIIYDSAMKIIYYVPPQYEADEFIVPEGVEDIGRSFDFNTGIIRIVLPKSLKVLSYNAFYHSSIIEMILGGERFFLDDKEWNGIQLPFD